MKRFIANLGDVNWLDYGGLFVFRDGSRAFMVKVEPTNSEHNNDGWDEWEWDIPALTPKELEQEWFAKDLPAISACCGSNLEELKSQFGSEDLVARAMAYREVEAYWGPQDSYPNHYDRNEMHKLNRKYRGVK